MTAERGPLRASWVDKVHGARRLTLQLGHLCYRAGDNAIEHDAIEHAGYLAFLGMLAMFPFLFFLVALTGLVGASATGAHLITFLFDHLPPHLVDAVRPRVQEILTGPPQGLLTLAILGAIWTSSSAVEGYRTILNRAYHVKNVPRYWVRRLVSIGQLLVFSFLVLTLMLVLVIVPVALKKLPLSGGTEIWEVLQLLGSTGVRLGTLLLLILTAANVYYILPNTKHRFRAMLPGAVLTAVGWMGATTLFSHYLSGVNRINLIYGSLGGVIATLLFFYVTNLIFIYGAELNYLLGLWWEERRLNQDGHPVSHHQQ